MQMTTLVRPASGKISCPDFEDSHVLKMWTLSGYVFHDRTVRMSLVRYKDSSIP